MLKPTALFWLAGITAAVSTICEAADVDAMQSPSGNYRFSIGLDNGRPTYRVEYEDRTIIDHSGLGFQMDDGTVLGAKCTRIVPSHASKHDSTWKPVHGERSTICDNYTSQTFTLEGDNEVAVALEVRCYDQGVAFCYHINPQDSQSEHVISKERTEFAFTANHTTWTTESAQGGYTRTTISGMKAVYDRPQIFFGEADQVYLAVGEARLVDFARMRLAASKERKNTVVAALSSEVKFKGDLKTPWRFVMAAERPGALIENNDLILNLNDPCALADTSWIKPGKVLREISLSDKGAIACIDYAAANGIEFVLFDAGWYGHEYDNASDATTVTVDRKRSSGDLDMRNIVQYGKQRGIGILLYVNRRALEKQLDDILPLYKQWGIAGVKYGFVNVGSQHWTTWLHEAVRKAADHQLMVNVHDEYRPTGYSRTYPNLMTQEGIGGDETSPTPKKSLGIFFPRCLAGAADNTICYYDQRVAANMNHAFQLGKSVCFYSPWQFIHWYDRPAGKTPRVGGGGENQRIIGDEPELEFFAHLPTVWDGTKVLEGSIEEYAVVARRAGDEWYIGAMNAEKARSFKVKLDFLEPGRKYTMRSYTHDDSVPTRTRVKIESQPVDCDTVLSIDLQSNDGAAYRIM